MIKTIIFDFGDVFINLDKTAIGKEFFKLGDSSFITESKTILDQYETGEISTPNFISYLQNRADKSTKEQVINAWNAILLNFPKYRLDFIKNLTSKKKYQFILLSNTNELHINWVQQHISFYSTFKNCFDAFYLSHELKLRKPSTAIFQYVMDTHQLAPSETLFIDDTKENTDAAAGLGIHIWNNNPNTEDIIDLFSIKSDVF